MVAILEKTEHNTDFHQIVDFLEASHIRYALTISPTIYVSHIQQFWSTARIETTDQETKIIATVDGKPRTISESSLRRHLKLNNKEWLRYRTGQDRENIAKTSTMPHESSPRVLSLDADEGRGIIDIGEELGAYKSIKLGSNDTEEMLNVLSSMEAANILSSGGAAASVSPADVLPTAGVPTVSESFPTVSAIFTTATVEQIDAQVAREMEEEFARKNKRLSEQVARESEITRIHAEEELKLTIGLDRSNEVIAKHLSEYEQAKVDLSVEEKIELISELVKYQDHRAKILKYQAQQSKPLSKKEQMEFTYQGSSNRVKISHTSRSEPLQEQQFKGSKGVSEEELKGMMQLNPLEEVYIEALQQFDRKDLHQLWILVKETFSIKQPTRDKEKELWVELKRLFKPDSEDQLWTYDQAFMHDPLDWKLYDTCGVHHVDSYVVPASAASAETTDTASDGTSKKKGRTVTVTADDMQRRKNDVKARTTLLLSLPDEHQLRFSKYKTAQELWAAILKTFGGNEATKKTKKNLLKQQYGTFKAEGTKTLEQTFNRLSDLDTMSLDNLYNYLKVYESKVQKKSEPNPQNMAFISSAKHIRGNEDVTTASVSTTSTNIPTFSTNVGVASISQDTAYAYIASQSSGKKISIQGTDMAGFDKSKAPKALMEIDRVGWDWSYMANDEENHALVVDEEAPIEFSLMANTSAESKVFDNSLCSKDCKKNTDSLNNKITDLTDKLFNANNMIYHYKLGLAQVESRLVEHREREIKYCEKIRGLELDVEFKTNNLECLAKKLETLKKEKEGLYGKLAGFQTASKDLDSLLESQRLDKNKEGLGYSVVPPPLAQIYSSPKKDMSWAGLPEFKDDTVTDYSRPAPTVESSLDNAQNKNPSVTKTKASTSTILPKSFIKFVKANDSPTKSKIDKAEKAKKSPVKYAEQYRKPTQKPCQRKSKELEQFEIPSIRPPMRPMRSNMNGARLNRTSFNKSAHSYTNRHFQRTSAVRSQYRAPWVLTVNRNFPPVNRKFSTVSRNFSTANRKFPTGGTKFHTADMGKKGKHGSSQNNIDNKGYWDSGCSRHMTGNISYLFDYEPFDGGYVSFGQGGCKITGK
nr:hypothetical protein [Tanacetum cinerariifolium]